jgi:hypothetical protein
MNFKSQDVRPFVDKVYELVESQELRLRKAAFRNDRWHLRPEYQHLKIDQNKWFNMTERSQKNQLQKFII